MPTKFEVFEILSDVGAGGDDLKGDDIHPAGFDGGEVVGDTEVFFIFLTGKVHAGDLLARIFRVIDDELIAGGLDGVVAIGNAGLDDVFADDALFESGEEGFELFADKLLVLFTFFLMAAPLQTEEDVGVHEGEDIAKVDGSQLAGSPEGGGGDGNVLADGAADDGFG